MKRNQLKKEIKQLITGKKEDQKSITFFYLNPETGKRELLHKEPDEKDLEIDVDSPETADALLKLRNPEKYG